MKSSTKNNSADQSAHLQSLEPTTEVEISQLISKVLCKQGGCRSACSFAQAQNNSADQPAHLHSLRLAFDMLTNVGPIRINNVGPTLNQHNLYNMSYV